METILENFFCQFGVGFQDRENGRGESESLHTNPIDAGEETVHVVMARTLHQPRPIHLGSLLLHKECPIQDLTQGHPYGREVQSKMTKKEKGVEIGRGEIYGLPLNLESIATVLRQLLELSLQLTVGTTSEGVHEIIMILHGNLFPIESGVMFVLATHRYTLLALNGTVCLSPFAEEIDVDVSTGAQSWLGVVEAEAMSLEEHHGDVVLGIKAGQITHRLFMLTVELALVIGHSQELQTGDIKFSGIQGIEYCLRGGIDLGMGVVVYLQAITCQSCQSLHGGQFYQAGPIDMVWEMGIRLLVDAETRQHEEGLRGFA